MIEENHFDLKYTPSQALGHKALAVNISDVAAMGGMPRWALVSLALPPHTSLEFFDGIFKGMKKLAQAAEVEIVGGDIASAPVVVMDVSILGEACPKHLRYRSQAVPGEVLMVTGDLGSSAAGLYWLQQGSAHTDEELSGVDELTKKHLQPWPRYREAQALREQEVGAMIDLSDGLAAGVEEICIASKVGASIDYSRLPCLRPTIELSCREGCSLDPWVLYGGEDYELLFTLPAAAAPQVQQRLREETGTSAIVIGEVLAAEEGVKLRNHPEGIDELNSRRSYRHFPSSSQELENFSGD